MSRTNWIATALILVWFAWSGQALAAAPLQEFTDVHLVTDDFGDGDSFRITTGNTTMVVRLYFVDCPETRAPDENMARRVRAQTRYFSLPAVSNTLAFGRAARDFTRARLLSPFTVHTAFSAVMGRDGEWTRYYAFITTADGADLAGLLVAHGYARAIGAGRPTPAGVTQAEQRDRLFDLEAAAMLKRVGIWAQSDPERLPESRSIERQEKQDLNSLVYGSADAETAAVDPNLATREELEALPGIGPVMAKTIIAGRPYTNVTDLLRLRGFSPKLMEQMDSRLAIGNAAVPSP